MNLHFEGVLGLIAWALVSPFCRTRQSSISGHGLGIALPYYAGSRVGRDYAVYLRLHVLCSHPKHLGIALPDTLAVC